MFDEIMATLKRYPDIDHLRLNEETVLSLPELEINLDRRKAYYNQKEIILTVKEYEILCLLCKNIGRVLTYEQIYQAIWGADALGNEKRAIGFHVRNLRKKIFSVIPSSSLTIENIREVGYRIKKAAWI
ncbi:MAG: winged helix-turn-helix domain-containing protein [Oscillospiraceae bacterium]|nr:winged helix-turn-helix domain-containing protein [Oscillospiraceae bacterium]